MVTRKFFKLLTITATSVILSACSWDCGENARMTASGTVRDAAGLALGTANVNLSDNLNPSFLRLSVSVSGSSASAGAPLKGHVTRARLLTEAGEVLGEVPTGTSTLASDVVVALNIDLSRPEYDKVRAALFTGKAKVAIDTDLVGREHIETTLSNVTDLGPRIQNCSPA